MQRVVITGGSSGLGLELARRLADEAASLALLARDAERLEIARQELLRRGARAVEVITADVRDSAALSAAFTTIAERLGGIDMLINSAGILREGYFESLSEETFRSVVEVNLVGPVNVTRAALPHLRAARGAIVNVASVGGLQGVFGYSAYNASKYGLVGFSEALRVELRPQGVRVHVVCPPEFDSPMIDVLDTVRTPENRAHTLTIPKHNVETIAQEALAGVRRGRFLIVTGRRARAAVLVGRLVPQLTRAVGDWRVSRVYVGPG